MPTIMDIDLSLEACDLRMYDALCGLTTDPDSWDQSTWGVTDVADWACPKRGSWPCHTFACLFGRLAIEAGLAEMGSQFEDQGWWLQINDAGVALLHHYRSVSVANEPGEDKLKFIQLGALLTRITFEQAQRMAEGGNTLGELWTLAQRYTDGRVVMPATLVNAVAYIDGQRAGIEQFLAGGSVPV